MRAKGQFDAKMTPQPPHDTVDGVALARMRVDKRFHGELEATGVVEMLSAGGPVKGSAGYVAIELVTDRGTKEPLGADAMNAIVRRCLENGVIVLTAGTYSMSSDVLPSRCGIPYLSMSCATKRMCSSGICARRLAIKSSGSPFASLAGIRRSTP